MNTNQHSFAAAAESDSVADSVASHVASLLHSPAGIDILSALVGIDPMKLTKSGRVDYLSALEKQSGWLQSLMQRAIVAVAGSEPTKSESKYSNVDDANREEVGAALRMSGNTAQYRIDVARTLTAHLPETCNALATGEISAAHATAIARESANIIASGASVEMIQKLESGAIAHAEFHTPAQVTNQLRSAIAKLAPEEFAEAARSAHDSRRVSYFPERDGMATIVAFLPAADAQTVLLAIDKLARISSGEVRDSNRDANKMARFTKLASDFADLRPLHSLDAFRADALTQFASTYLATSGETNLKHRRPITLNLTLDLPTLLGFENNPGQLTGYGPIPAEIARELAADAKWRKFITHPENGNLLDYGRESYDPPQILKDFLLARDRTCRFPGCRAPGHLADIDHAIAWDKGGETNTENMGLLCRRHHRMKTHGDWKLESFPDGSCKWISPAGKEYFVPARPINGVA